MVFWTIVLTMPFMFILAVLDDEDIKKRKDNFFLDKRTEEGENQ